MSKNGNGPTCIISALRRVKIRHRLLTVFFFISLVPVICLGVYAYTVYTGSINSKLGVSSLQAILSLNKNMVTELEKFQDYCSMLSVSAPVQQGLYDVSVKNLPVSRDMVTGIREISSRIPFQSKYLKNLRVVDTSGNILYDLGYDDIPRERFSEILAKIDASSPRDSLRYIHTYRSTDKLVLGRKLYDINASNQPIGYIMVYIDEHLISDQIFSDVSFGENSNVMLVDSDGFVISSPDRKLLGSGLAPLSLFEEIRGHLKKGENSFNTVVDGIPSLVIAAHNTSFDNYLVASIPMSYITDETRSITYALAGMAAFLILVSLGCTMLVYLSILRPVKNMVSFCGVIPVRMPEARIRDESPDELGLLARTVDGMLNNLDALMERGRQDQARQRELELQMLQYQITPHFLFNTLNSLQWVAVVNDVPVLAEGISSLSSLLRNTLMKKDEFIPLSEEIDNLNNYFCIQRIRYGNNFDVVYDLDERTLPYRIPRFVLQPLAENSILHGSDGAADTVTVTVFSSLSPESLIIEIRDDGKGFDPNREKSKKSDHFSGIGAGNVAERLKIYYGSEDCLKILSREGKGTVCRITIPLTENTEREDGDDVQHSSD